MRAVIYTRKGPAAEVLQIVERPDPKPGRGEVRVKMAFSGVNPSDVKSRLGVSARVGGYPETIPHSDGAGVVDQVGVDTPATLLGARVWIFNGQWDRPFGTCAQYITLPVAQIVSLPAGISFEVGASIGIPLMTAMHAVLACGALLGKTVLVPGAAGSVGLYVTQLAAMAGARVIAIVSSDEKAAWARSAGAHECINYKTESLVDSVHAMTAGRGADAILDVDAATHAPHYGQLLCTNGQAVVYGSSQAQISMPFGPLITGFIRVYYFMVYKLLAADRRAVLEGIAVALARPGFCHPPVAIHSLDDIVQAHQQTERGANAKVLVRL